MAALGADRRQLLALGLARNLVVGLAGAGRCVDRRHRIVAVAPLGEARVAESYTGVSFDAPGPASWRARPTWRSCLSSGYGQPFGRRRALPSDDRAEVPTPIAHSGPLGGAGSTPERSHRCAQRLRAQGRQSQCPGRLCPPRHHPRGYCAVRDGGLRGQPRPPDSDSEAVRGHLSAELYRPERYGARRHPSRKSRAQPRPFQRLPRAMPSRFPSIKSR